MASSEYFRAGVGIVVVNAEGLALGLERCDVPGSWQLPQGGIEQGEEPLAAARRELGEETGIDWRAVQLVAEHPRWLAYELPPSSRSPKTGRGQVHRWFLVRFRGSDAEIDLDASAGSREFSSWRWMRFDEILSLTWDVRRPIYEALRSSWSDHLAVS